MRVVEIGENGELRLTKDLARDVPANTILSHVWGTDEEELTFGEMSNGTGKDKAGYSKITFCRDQTRKDGLRHFWLDTCCIDKTNSTELSEAINSMFRWYSEAYRCYVLLPDVSFQKSDIHVSDGLSEAAFRNSKWFTRGWTLPELLAPTSVEFFSKEENFMGNKRTLKVLIHEITGIPIDALRGIPLDRFSTTERMRWVDHRKTTKLEDLAYCLLGIFNIFIPPIYGEGTNAFIRLEEAITKAARSNVEPEYMSGRRAQLSLRTTAGIGLGDTYTKAVNALRFDQMDTRHSTIQRAYSVTCRWILTHPMYLQWTDPSRLDDHGGLFWIKGKPGAGKSTLMKFIHAETRRNKASHDIIISFFFNARGSDLEKTTVGMYRALLFQLMNEAPDLHELLDIYKPPREGQSPDSFWTTQILCDLLAEAITRLQPRRLTCFIDALDECDEPQVRDMVVFFDELRETSMKNGSSLFISFASRHYPTIGIHECCELVLEKETAHDEDLAKYVHGHLLGIKTKYMQEVAAQVLEKASGVFLWVVLVVNILNKVYSGGRMYAIKERLRETPAQLSELFKDMLRRDFEDMPEFLLCLRLILYAKRPLALEEFYFAMLAGSRPEDLTEWDRECPTTNDMWRFLLSCSKGLAELTKSQSKSTVQFIHESVRGFLIRDAGLAKLWSGIEDTTSSSHDQLKSCCQTYLSTDLSIYLPKKSQLPEASSTPAMHLREALDNKFPFLEYAVSHVLHHANEAALGQNQHSFLNDFPLARWIKISNAFKHYELRRYTGRASFLYILAKNHYARLIGSLCGDEMMMGNRGELYQYPIFAALAAGHREAVRALFKHPIDSDTDPTIETLRYGQAFSFQNYHTPLTWALENGHTAILHMLLSCVDLDVSAKETNGRDALSRVAESGNAQGLLLLLANARTYIDSADVKGRTPLMYATMHSHQAIVRHLLDSGASVKFRDRDGQSALMLAAAGGLEDIAKMLVYSGADLETKDRHGRTALLHAAEKGWDGVLKYLLVKGANIEAMDRQRRRPLMLAAHGGWHDCVFALLEKKPDLEAQDDLGRTAIIFAAQGAQENLVTVLRQVGASTTAVRTDIPGATWVAHAELEKAQDIRKIQADVMNAETTLNDHNTVAGYYAANCREVCGVRCGVLWDKSIP